MKKILLVTSGLVFGAIVTGYGATWLFVPQTVPISGEEPSFPEVAVESPAMVTNEDVLKVDDSVSIDTAKVSPSVDLKVGDVIEFKREMRTAYFDIKPYEGEVIRMEFASSTHYPEKDLPDLPYQVTKVQRVSSEDGIVDHLAFYACPWPDFSEVNDDCERFVLNNKGYVVALESYGYPKDFRGGSVVDYDFNYYPYIYLQMYYGDATTRGGESLVGYDPDRLEKRTLWSHSYGLWSDESCGLIEPDPEFGWKVNGSFEYYSLDMFSPELRVEESSSCSGLKIYSKNQSDGQVEGEKVNLLLAVDSYTKVESEFSKDNQHVLIVVDSVEYKYSFETDTLELVR